MKVLIFVIVFLLIGGFFIISNKNIALNGSENVGLFFREYASWIDALAGNGKVVSGYVVKMEWLPGEGETGSSLKG